MLGDPCFGLPYIGRAFPLFSAPESNMSRALLVLLVLFGIRDGAAQSAWQPVDTLAFAALKWRNIGPYRSGRSVAAAGSVARPNEYYSGTTGGGVMKTTNGGYS